MAVSSRQRVLLVNPPSKNLAYDRPGRSSIARVHPPLGLASLAAALRECAEVRILDLNVQTNPERSLSEMLKSFAPTQAGVTGTTPMFPSMKKILRRVKEFDPSITTMAGGPHVSALPEKAASEDAIDLVVVGEGESTVVELLENEAEDVAGVCFGSGGTVFRTPERPPATSLDELPLPAWDLFDLRRYHAPAVMERHPPAALVETSRGCPHRCSFCCRAPFGKVLRLKSPSRVVEEFQHARNHGFREIHIEDDSFAEDIERAKEVCRALISAGPPLPWNLINGVRVDRFDPELAGLLAKAGCYQVGFGIETGSGEILDLVHKDVSIQQVTEALSTAKEARLETIGYFILGLPRETEEDLMKTISLACSLPLDYAKFALFVPYPGSEDFARMEKEGRILTRDWSAYLFHDQHHEVFKHPHLQRKTLAGCYTRAYRRFYLRPSYILRRVLGSIRTGTFLKMARDFIRTKW